jgi:hypothetical protein
VIDLPNLGKSSAADCWRKSVLVILQAAEIYSHVMGQPVPGCPPDTSAMTAWVSRFADEIGEIIASQARDIGWSHEASRAAEANIAAR